MLLNGGIKFWENYRKWLTQCQTALRGTSAINSKKLLTVSLQFLNYFPGKSTFLSRNNYYIFRPGKLCFLKKNFLCPTIFHFSGLFTCIVVFDSQCTMPRRGLAVLGLLLKLGKNLKYWLITFYGVSYLAEPHVSLITHMEQACNCN